MAARNKEAFKLLAEGSFDAGLAELDQDEEGWYT